MADIVSLNRARKARTKASEKAAAAENRVKFGRTKAEKLADRKAADVLDRHVDAHKLTNEPD